jgi:hypothetical protein
MLVNLRYSEWHQHERSLGIALLTIEATSWNPAVFAQILAIDYANGCAPGF